MSDWDAEEIPDEDLLFYRIHSAQLRKGKLHPGVFRERHGGMSVDWSKYSSAQQTRARATSDPADNGVVSFLAGIPREAGLDVTHTPSPENRAHTDVSGIPPSDPKKTEVRYRIFRAATWEIEAA